MAESSHDHRVQFYGGDERALIRNVRQYLSEGVQNGGGVLVVATEEHWARLARYISSRGQSPLDSGVLRLDAESTLNGLLVGGKPDRLRFTLAAGA